MQRKVINETDFSEIFHFAEKEFGIGWNPCNDLFFGGPLTYQSFDDRELDELIEYTDEAGSGREIADYSKEEILKMRDNDKAWFILGKFMIANNVKQMRVDNT